MSMEIFIVRKGEYEITCNNLNRKVADGAVAVFDSYDVHSYNARRSGEEETRVVIIPYRHLGAFNVRRGNLCIAEPVINDKALCERLWLLAEEYLSGEHSGEHKNEFLIRGRGEMIAEGAAALMMGLICEKLQFTVKKERDEAMLVRTVLSYIQENFRNEATLGSIARALGYTEAHISRVFHRYVKCGLPEYVNGLRMEYIQRLREQGDTRKMVELVYEAGFKSQQTYYRVKKRARGEE